MTPDMPQIPGPGAGDRMPLVETPGAGVDAERILADDPVVPDALDMAFQESVCPQTLRGWLWYCHEHDSHGNADSQEEAECVAGGHEMFWVSQLPEDADPDDSPCDVIVWMRTAHERLG
jgi:hypothetical protein